MKKAFLFLFFFIATMIACITYAFAYIDPSSVTYIIQIAAGAVVAVGAGIGFYWKRIRRFIRRKRKEREEARIAAAEDKTNEN